MNNLNVEVKLKNGMMPVYKSEFASGADLRSSSKDKIILMPHDTKIIPTGVYLSIPEGFEAQIRSRSGLACTGLVVANSPGTIDADYRGEVKVILHNQSKLTHDVNYGDRIAQMVFAPVVQAEFKKVDALSITIRNTDGFGSTGIK